MSTQGGPSGPQRRIVSRHRARHASAGRGLDDDEEAGWKEENASGDSEDAMLDRESADAQSPLLTLMEEVVLVGLKDQKGYLSFLNDSISYVLRGCILIELSLRNRIGVERDERRRALSDRYVQVIDTKQTGEVLLDEALAVIRSERHTISQWIDLLSGETWNPAKVRLQLRQVRERIAKGLVDKGILRTEKRQFLLFDMPTHPLTDYSVKDSIVQRIIQTLVGQGQTPSLRTICLVLSCSAANVLGSALNGLGYGARQTCALRAEELVREFATDRMSDRLQGNAVVAGVLSVFTRMDNLLY